MGSWLESLGLIAGNKTQEKDKVRLSALLVNLQTKQYKIKLGCFPDYRVADS